MTGALVAAAYIQCRDDVPTEADRLGRVKVADGDRDSCYLPAHLDNKDRRAVRSRYQIAAAFALGDIAGFELDIREWSQVAHRAIRITTGDDDLLPITRAIQGNCLRLDP